MEYTVQNFEPGSILTAEALNKMDNLILNNLNSITDLITRIEAIEAKLESSNTSE